MVHSPIMGARYYVAGITPTVVPYDGDKCGWFPGVWPWQMAKSSDPWEVDTHNWVVAVVYGADYSW